MTGVIVVAGALVGCQCYVIGVLLNRIRQLERDQEDTLKWVRREMIPKPH